MIEVSIIPFTLLLLPPRYIKLIRCFLFYFSFPPFVFCRFPATPLPRRRRLINSLFTRPEFAAIAAKICLAPQESRLSRQFPTPNLQPAAKLCSILASGLHTYIYNTYCIDTYIHTSIHPIHISPLSFHSPSSSASTWQIVSESTGEKRYRIVLFLEFGIRFDNE